MFGNSPKNRLRKALAPRRKQTEPLLDQGGATLLDAASLVLEAPAPAPPPPAAPLPDLGTTIHSGSGTAGGYALPVGGPRRPVRTPALHYLLAYLATEEFA